MSDAAIAEPTTDIATIIETNPVAVLLDQRTYSDFLKHIKAETDAFVPDLSTATSRKEIASLAYKVTRTKTAIDNAGKKLNEDARSKINKVDEQRRKIRGELETLAEQVRKPLTDWEQAEEDRIEAAAKFFDVVRAFRHIQHGAGSGAIRDQLDTINEMTVDAAVLRERADEAAAALEDAKHYLTAQLELMLRAEADARDLEKLRAEQEARQKAEREAAAKANQERIAKEVAERAAAEAAKREAEAAERARQEEQRKAQEAIDRAEREKREAIAKAEREKQALIEAQERAEAERIASERRAAEAQAARDADEKHRAAVKAAASEAIAACGCAKRTADKIVLAILAGEIPNVTLRF